MTRDFRDHEDIWFGSDLKSTLPTNVYLFFVDLADEGCIEKLGDVIEA